MSGLLIVIKKLISGDVSLSTDDQIIKRVLKGHSEDFCELIRRYQDAVFCLAFRILSRREEAEDAVQETFLRVYQNLSSYKEQGKFWPWVRRIAVNRCISKIPREFPSDEVEMMLDSKGPYVNTVEEEVIHQMEMEDVYKVIDGLPVEYRTAVVLRYMEGLQCSEMAELLGEQASTVRVRLHRAHKMIAERLAVINDGLY